MEPVNLFDLATRQSQWLAVRQSAIASNIANANTPGYTANDVEPFEKVLDRTAVLVREGKPLSSSLASSGMMPQLAVDVMQVGESTGALPQMLSSVAEFYEDDVSTRMTALLSLIEPAIMIFMGIFVAFVLVALYLPIFSLADTIR